MFHLHYLYPRFAGNVEALWFYSNWTSQLFYLVKNDLNIPATQPRDWTEHCEMRHLICCLLLYGQRERSNILLKQVSLTEITMAQLDQEGVTHAVLCVPMWAGDGTDSVKWRERINILPCSETELYTCVYPPEWTMYCLANYLV